MESANRTSPTNDAGQDEGVTGDARSPITEVLAAFAALEFQNARVLGLIGQTTPAGRSDLRALLFLAQNAEATTPKQLAEHLLLSTGATTALVDRMASADLVRRVPHPTDRRSVVVELGPEGRATVERVSDFYRRVFRAAVEPEHATELAATVRRLGDVLGRVAEQEISSASERSR